MINSSLSESISLYLFCKVLGVICELEVSPISTTPSNKSEHFLLKLTVVPLKSKTDSPSPFESYAPEILWAQIR